MYSFSKLAYHCVFRLKKTLGAMTSQLIAASFGTIPATLSSFFDAEAFSVYRASSRLNATWNTTQCEAASYMLSFSRLGLRPSLSLVSRHFTCRRMRAGGRKGNTMPSRGYWIFDCLFSAHFTGVAVVNYQQVSKSKKSCCSRSVVLQ